MSVSSLREKMSTTKLLSIFLVGLLSLTFLILIANKVFAATAAPIAPTSTSAVGIQTITYTWTAATGFSGSKWVVATSTNRVPTAAQIAEITNTSTVSFVANGLATNTLYYLGAAGGDATGATSSYATSSAVYTLAATPGTPSKSATSTTSFTVTINSSTNPSNTTFIVRDSGGTTPVYLQSDGTWGASSSTSFTAVQLGAINGTSTTGLTANTTHTIAVAAVNGDGVTTSFSTAAATFYTLANTPSAPTVAASANSLTFSWTGDATDYLASDDTAGTNSGYISGTSYTVTGINCGTTHSFTVSGRNGDEISTATTTAVTGTTNACGSGAVVGGGSGGGGGQPQNPFSAIPATPATPAVPSVTPAEPATPATPAAPASVSLPSTASPVAVFRTQLRVGSKGNEVKALQAKLRELGFFTYPTDTGFFGGVTRKAVVAFQKDQGLKPYPGHVGPATRAALNSL
ncbi:MAG: hypothetical protein G01um101413_910 [Parcubacteria group bacterium Gr01-1014_13]|nr:MAG: hypothetical protein G01um101413_910 [Parcubacteria group bacterium Gr01-1014_13]